MNTRRRSPSCTPMRSPSTSARQRRVVAVDRGAEPCHRRARRSRRRAIDRRTRARTRPSAPYATISRRSPRSIERDDALAVTAEAPAVDARPRRMRIARRSRGFGGRVLFVQQPRRSRPRAARAIARGPNVALQEFVEMTIEIAGVDAAADRPPDAAPASRGTRRSISARRYRMPQAPRACARARARASQSHAMSLAIIGS